MSRDKIFVSLEFMTKSYREVPIFLEITEVAYNTASDEPRVACMPKTSWIRSAVLIQYQLVIDGQTHCHS